MLHLEHLLHQRRELLVHRDHPRSLRIRGAVVGGIAIHLADAEAVEREAPQQLHGRDGIALVLRHDVRERTLRAVHLDDVASRLVAIVEDVFAELGAVVQCRDGRRDHDVDRVAQAPAPFEPRAQVQRRRARVLVAGRQLRDGARAGRGAPATLRLGPPRRDVLVDRHVVDVARIVRIECRQHVRRARLVVRVELLRDQRADRVDLARRDRRSPEADGIGERRDPDARGERRRLVVHVDDVWLPLAPHALPHARLDAVHHVAVAVVVVPHVLLVGLVRERRLPGHCLPAVVDDDVLPVGIDRRPEEEDDVVENLPDLRVAGRLREQLVGKLRRMLRAGGFRGVQPAADVHDDLPLAREAMRRGVGEPGRVRELHVDLPIVIELRPIRGRRDDRDRPLTAERRLANVQQVDAVARGRQFPEVGDGLFVVQHLAIGADRVTEVGLRRGDPGRAGHLCWHLVRTDGGERERACESRGGASKGDQLHGDLLM